MNCKPGDLAIIVRHSKWSGWIVEVVSALPAERFEAPDGTPFRADMARNSDWLIRAARPFGQRPHTKSIYAMCPDSALRPLPGESEPDAVPAPSRELETA